MAGTGLDRPTLAAVGYRFRATFRRRWAGYLAIVLLVGLIGGLAMGAIAGARRTQSSYATFLASTNPSDMTIAIFPQGPAAGYTGHLARTIARLPGVKKVESWVQPFGVPLKPDGAPRLGTLSQVTVVGSVNGLSFDVDRPAVVQGRMADPKSLDELVTTPAGAQAAGWKVGQTVPVGFYTEPQIAASDFAKPLERVQAKLVGLVEFNDGIVQDQVDRYPTFALFTPAFTQRLMARSAASTYATYYGLQLVHGSRAVPRVEREFSRIVPPTVSNQIHVTALIVAQADRAIKPESIALGVFGVIAALAGLAIGALAIARQLQGRATDLEVLRALGASPAAMIGDELVGVLAAVVLGAALAAGVAIALSPIAPIGPVRSVYPAPGFAIDWPVLGLGMAVAAAGLGGLALWLAYRNLPQRKAGRRQLGPVRRRLSGSAAALGCPPPVVAGVQFALEPGDARNPVPVRSALMGTALAVVVVVATLTFGSGLTTLVSNPPLYGWNWSYALGSEDAPDVPPQAVARLRHDPDVAAWTDASIGDPQIDGQTVPAIFEPNDPAVAPPVLSGHQVQAADQIVLGAATIQRLHTHVGGTVTASYGSPASAPMYVPPTVLHVVGTATLPAIGFPSSEGDHTSMGTGAVMSVAVLPPAFKKASEGPDQTLDGPEYVFVRMKDGVSQAAGLADIRRVAAAGGRAFSTDPNGGEAGSTVTVFSDLLPAEIVNYRSIGTTPAWLAGSLAAGTVVALGLTLLTSVRRRRRDLALLKALGFTQRQLSASVAVQATVIGLVGLVVGMPLGIALGRWMWVLFARQIYAVPAPTVPVLALVAVGAAALVLVNLVAVGPGRAAARTPTALVLRTE